MATPMILLSQAGSAANDIVGVFFVLAAVALYVNAGASRAALVLAGVAAGLAIGVKLSMLAPVLALTAGVLVLSPTGRRRADALAWLVPLVLAGGFWFGRNLIAVGNPLPWVNLPGLAIPAAPLQAHTGFSIAHYLFHPHAWRGLLEPGLAAGFGSWWWAILAAVVIGPLLCLLPGAGARVRMLGLVALASIVAYLITPETAAGPAGHPLGFAFNLRYSAPALTLALAVLPLAPAFAGRRAQLGLAAVLSLVLVVTLTHRGLWDSPQLIGQILVAVAVLAVLAAALLHRPRLLASLGAVALVAVCAAGFLGQRNYLRSRYGYQPGISHLSRLWALFRSVHNARVGLTGTFGGFFSYPLYGVDVSNRVQYIAAPGPHGSFTPIGACGAWRGEVNRLHLRYVVITPNRDPWRPKRLLPAPEGAWIASDPAARLVFRRRAQGQDVAVYQLTGRLSPIRCS
jgi:hypothetical protein